MYEDERKEIIEYGLHQGKVMLVWVLTVLSLGYIFHILEQSILFLIAFVSLRRFAGGYHAESQEVCYVVSFLVLVVTFFLIKEEFFTSLWIRWQQTLGIITIMILAPVENNNHILTNEERIEYGNKTRIIVIILFVIYVISEKQGYLKIANSTGAAIVVVLISLVIGFVKRYIAKKKILLKV